MVFVLMCVRLCGHILAWFVTEEIAIKMTLVSPLLLEFVVASPLSLCCSLHSTLVMAFPHPCYAASGLLEEGSWQC